MVKTHGINSLNSEEKNLLEKFEELPNKNHGPGQNVVKSKDSFSPEESLSDWNGYNRHSGEDHLRHVQNFLPLCEDSNNSNFRQFLIFEYSYKNTLLVPKSVRQIVRTIATIFFLIWILWIISTGTELLYDYAPVFRAELFLGGSEPGWKCSKEALLS